MYTKDYDNTFSIDNIQYFCDNYRNNKTFETFVCNEDISYYWFSRHYNFRGSLISLGKLPEDEPENLRDLIEAKKPFAIYPDVQRQVNLPEYVYCEKINGYIFKD